MNEYDLFLAIGGADDAFLSAIQSPSKRRLPRHFGLIAALMALLLTACAAPVIVQHFDKVPSGERSETGNGYMIYEYHSESKESPQVYFLSSDAQIQVTVNEDAPNRIETQYIPLQLLDYCNLEEYEITDTALTLTLSTTVPRFGSISGALYHQYVLPKNGSVTVPHILGAAEWEKNNSTYGNITVLEFEGYPAYHEDSNGERLLFDGNHIPTFYTKILFWSDGNYLYCLKIPITYYLPATAIEGILTSLTQVEDIAEYLTVSE